MDWFLPLVWTFSVSFLAIRLAKPIAVKIGLVDIPTQRKVHVGSVPLVGGIAIYIGVLTASMMFIEQSQSLNIYLLSAAMVLFIGVLDDKYDLSVRLRIASQIFVACMMIFGAEHYLHSFGGLFGHGTINLGVFGILVTIVAVIGCINAFNMIDGIDGLAGMLSLVAFSSLGFLFSAVTSEWFLLPIIFIAGLAAYLMFNLGWPSKALTKVFMGDAGNMFIGLTIAWLLVIGTEAEMGAFRPVTALYIIAIPLMDMAAIMYRRIKKGKSPFKPDRDHLHHIFERAGFTRRQTLAIITVISFMFAGFGCLGELYQWPEWLMFMLFIAVFSMYNLVLSRIWTIIAYFKKIK
ncbi:UDP-N-acetylglucosamine--undecaprenyl-phosphate N-acetylglucosaminephosphotransferase [Shewanella youngdeokensis]|uniref:Undecaprenyl-phosphate alpha-N-acetylglucosaminyl 1-phosphate transferase n=1 Tax=Shewanella youngdeokensis TaxID=2999068 RepID=A0ABZ0K3G0_9GAMM|nr:UDP-N-acetylglucosamine--undecaprenyl-phosphate N-acetylglucosaminephosphotransferase [Shewanella sp. DAU334]